jgi:hypothetical protein
MMTYRNLNLAALMLTVACGSISPVIAAEDAATPVELDAPAPADANQPNPVPGGDDVGTDAGVTNAADANTSNAVPAEDNGGAEASGKEGEGTTTDAAATPEDSANASNNEAGAAAAQPAEATASATPSEPATPDEHFDKMYNNMATTHPEEAKKLKKEYHAKKDKSAVLAKWSKTAIESQDMLDAVEELFAIYQVLKNIDGEVAADFEKKVEDEKDPRTLLEYAHQLLLKTLKDRKAQIQTAKAELESVSVILQYVDGDKAQQVSDIERTAEDPRAQISEAYDLLEKTLEEAHKEVGLKPLQ